MAVTAAGGVLAATAVVGTQVAGQNTDVAQAGANTTTDDDSDAKAAARVKDRTTKSVSRDSARPSLTELKKKSLQKSTVTKSATGVITEKAKVDVSDPKALAKEMLGEYGWNESQFQCLDDLWVGESNWRVKADNPSSSAYGIPQALPGSKMASAGSDWETNPATQIKWGLGYIKDRYGSPCEANSFKQGNNFY